MVFQGKLSIKPSDKSLALVKANLEEIGEPRLQNWLTLDMSQLTGEVVALPTRDDVMLPIEDHLIIEFCSR